MRYLKIFISLLFVTLIIAFVFNSVWKSQGDSGFQNIDLNIDNQSSGLWESSKTDTSWFKIEGLQINTNNTQLKRGFNPSFDVFLSEYDDNQKESFPDGFELFIENSRIKGIRKGKRLHCSISYNDIIKLNQSNLDISKNGDIKECDIVFGLVAPNKEDGHYRLNFWLEKGDFDIASGDGFNNNAKAIYFTVEVNNQTATSIVVLIVLLVLIVSSLLCWFFILKKEFYPNFEPKGQLYINKPTSDTISLQQNARKLIIGNGIKEKETFFTKLFLGKIQYIYQDSGHSAILVPYRDFKTKKILYRIRVKNDTFVNTQSEKLYLVHSENYSLDSSGEIFSFEYFNLKHQ